MQDVSSQIEAVHATKLMFVPHNGYNSPRDGYNSLHNGYDFPRTPFRIYCDSPWKYSEAIFLTFRAIMVQLGTQLKGC